MKLISIVLLMLLTVPSLQAQAPESHLIYGEIDYIFGNYFGGEISLNYAYQESYVVNISFSEFASNADNTPSDFRGGIISAVTLGLGGPKDRIKTYAMSIGKMIKLNEANNLRLNLLVGAGYTTFISPTNWEKLGAIGVGNNYTWSTQKSNLISLVINPKFDYLFSKIAGLSFSPTILINKQESFYGFGIGLVFGKLSG